MECRCATCFGRAKLRLGFFTPEGWIKYKAPDGNVVYFCSQKCMEKFIFPAELEKKKRWKFF